MKNGKTTKKRKENNNKYYKGKIHASSKIQRKYIISNNYYLKCELT